MELYFQNGLFWPREIGMILVHDLLYRYLVTLYHCDRVLLISSDDPTRISRDPYFSLRFYPLSLFLSAKITHFSPWPKIWLLVWWSKMTTYLSDRGFPFVFWSFEYKDRLSSLFAILVDCLDAPSPWSFVWLDILWDGLCESVGLKKYYFICLLISLFLFCWRCWVRNIPDFATGSIAIADMLD